MARSWKAAAMAIALLNGVAIAAEDDFSPAQDAVCLDGPPAPGKNTRLEKERLVIELLDAQKVSVGDLNPRASPFGYAEYIAAILDPEGFCGARQCKKDAAKKLGTAATKLIHFMEQIQSTTPTARGFQIKGPQVGQRPDQYIDEFLRDRDGVRYQALCVATAAAPPIPPKPGTPPPEEKISTRVLVRQNTADLSFSQKSDQFKAAQRAGIAVNVDHLKNSNAYAIDGVAGLGIGPFEVKKYEDRSSSLDVVPFTSYKRQYVDGNNPKNVENVHNLGVGLLADYRWPALGIFHDVQLSPHLVHSFQSDADLIFAKLIYTPEPALPGWGVIGFPFGGAVSMVMKPQLKLIYGHVLDDGKTGGVLAGTKNIGHFGPRFEIAFTGEQSFVAGFGLRFSYEFLKSFDGPVYAARRLETALDYTFPEQKFWALQLKYVRGIDGDTLERQQLLTLGAGLKY